MLFRPTRFRRSVHLSAALLLTGAALARAAPPGPPPGGPAEAACTVTIKNCKGIPVGGSVVVGADVVPPKGTFAWEVTKGADHVDPDAFNRERIELTGVKASDMPDDVELKITYTAPDGSMCTDTCTLTVVGAKMILHKAKAMDGAEPALDDAEKFRKGVQIWLNEDNDDGDDTFDKDDDDVAGEDDMAKLVLELRPASPDYTALRVDGLHLPDRVRLWKQANKVDEYTIGTELSIFDFTIDGNKSTRELWIEGVKASAMQRETELQFHFEGEDTVANDKVSVTVLKVAAVKVKGKENGKTADGKNNGNDLDADPNFNDPGGLGAVRLFPGGRAPDFGTARDEVEIEVAISPPPVEDVDVYVRAFDLDDPSDETAFIDPNDAGGAGMYTGTALTYTADEDNRGEVDGNKAGKLDGQDGDGLVKLTFGKNEIEKSVDFTVSHHPGDNYRVAADGDPDFLKVLRNRDMDDGFEIRDGSMAMPKKIPDERIRSSVAITVWRMLHVERDSMKVLNQSKNEAIAKIEEIDDAADDVKVTAASLRLNGKPVADLDDGSKDEDDGKNGRFENGAIKKIGTTAVDFDIESNGDLVFSMDEEVEVACKLVNKDGKEMEDAICTNLEFAGTESTLTLKAAVDAGKFDDGRVQIAGKTYEIKVNTAMTVTTKTKVLLDMHAVDDDTATLPDMNLPDATRMVSGFQSTYVLPVFDGGGDPANDKKNADSVANMPDVEADFEALFKRDSAGNERDTFWVVYGLSTYQHDEDSDFDPNDESGTGGLTFAFVGNANLEEGGHGSSVNIETIRDREAAGANAGLEARVFVHEVGHQFGLDHIDTEENIIQSDNSMGPDAAHNHFVDRHVNLIRSRVKSPGQ